MARMSIYVPDELKGRMDPLNDRVNWSNIAQAAFETEIRLNPDWKGSRMTVVIERLRASKLKSANEDIQWGMGVGRKWAEETAEFKDLRGIAALPDPDDDDEFELDDLWRRLDPEMTSGRDEFWDSILGGDLGSWSSAFQVGFIRGAKAVWEEVEDQI